MNLSKSILDRQRFINLSEDIHENLGFKSYFREISLFLKESKNLNGITGHNLVTKINGTITNYSIVDDKDYECRILNKTVYICEIEFPKRITLDMLKRDINAFISIASIKPINAFMNCYVLYRDACVDLGLTMVDLTSSSEYDLHILNLSKEGMKNPLYHELIYSNKYNPKYYNSYDCKSMGADSEKRNGLIEEFHDNHTKLVCNTHGDESVDNFINNDSQTGIYINKRTISISESISELFNRYLFVCLEKLEFIYRSSTNELNIKTISIFSSFRQDLIDYICNQIKNTIDEWIVDFNKSIEYQDYYLIFSIDHQFAIFDINFLNENKEIRITKPIYKLYAEFSFNNEVFENDIGFLNKNNSIKLEYINNSILSLQEASKTVDNIVDAIGIANMAQKTTEMFIEASKNINNNLLQNNNVRCLESDKFQRSQRL